ncbi:hypothetical protein NE675_12140, partial [Megasphaera massiliensis]
IFLGALFKGCVKDTLHVGIDARKVTRFNLMIFQRLYNGFRRNAVFFRGFVYSLRHLVTPFDKSRFAFSMAAAN